MSYRTLATVGTLLATLAGCSANPPEQTAADSTDGSWQSCRPGYACATPFKVKVVLVTMFEIGADQGDAAGEFQHWKTRRGLDTRVPFPQGHHDLYVNEQTGVLGMVTGVGTLHSTGAAMALGLDQRFDLSEAYWLVAGIAGIDPEDASIGSAVWSAWLVDGDLGHEIDPREIPADWPTGYFARHTRFPYDPDRPEPQGEVFHINEGLRDWAFELTKDLELPDLAGLATTRERYTEHANARKPPFVLTGGHIAAMTFWHGAMLNQWANDWVSYWSGGATDFVTSAMEETGTYQSVSYLHATGRVDKDRFMVLRAGSNYTMPPPGVTAVDNLLAENEEYAGLEASLESLYLVGGAVIDELLDNWDRYAGSVPGAGGADAGGDGK